MPEKSTWTFEVGALPQPARLMRWGSFGTPVLLFPSAGGDCEELERCGVVATLESLLAAGRIKLYSVDGLAARAWLRGRESAARRAALQNAFDGWIHTQAVPQIRADCHDASIGIVVAGAAHGAFEAVACICRHPAPYRSAIGLSGRYDRSSYLGANSFTEDFYFSSPLHYLPGLGASPELESLRGRFIELASGAGDYEDPAQTTRFAQLLAAKGIPHRVDLWGPDYSHDWTSWRAMLARYLGELA